MNVSQKTLRCTLVVYRSRLSVGGGMASGGGRGTGMCRGADRELLTDLKIGHYTGRGRAALKGPAVGHVDLRRWESKPGPSTALRAVRERRERKKKARCFAQDDKREDADVKSRGRGRQCRAPCT